MMNGRLLEAHNGAVYLIELLWSSCRNFTSKIRPKMSLDLCVEFFSIFRLSLNFIWASLRRKRILNIPHFHKLSKFTLTPLCAARQAESGGDCQEEGGGGEEGEEGGD